MGFPGMLLGNYVMKRKLHPKKTDPKDGLQNKDKLTIKRRISILKSKGKTIQKNRCKQTSFK